MSRDVFVDTSGWYALIDRNDAAHAQATAVVGALLARGIRLVTTDYVIDESCTLAKVRAGPIAAIRLLEMLDQSAAVDVEWIGPDRFLATKRAFRKHADQAFSFTDCASFVVMRERKMSEAITADHHFRTAGFRALLVSPDA